MMEKLVYIVLAIRTFYFLLFTGLIVLLTLLATDQLNINVTWGSP